MAYKTEELMPKNYNTGYVEWLDFTQGTQRKPYTKKRQNWHVEET